MTAGHTAVLKSVIVYFFPVLLFVENKNDDINDVKNLDNSPDLSSAVVFTRFVII